MQPMVRQFAMGNGIMRLETDDTTIRFAICAATGAMIGAVFAVDDGNSSSPGAAFSVNAAVAAIAAIAVIFPPQ